MDPALVLAIGAIITAIGGGLSNIAHSRKTLAEARQISVQTQKVLEHSKTAAHEVTHNSGTSMKDAVSRIEWGQGELVKSHMDRLHEMAGFRREFQFLREEKMADHRDIRDRLTALERSRHRNTWGDRYSGSSE